jgi:hypothetical protein
MLGPILLALSLGAPHLHGLDTPTAKIEDDSSLRIAIRDSWFLEAPARVLSNQSFIHTLPGGGRIQVRTENTQNEVVVVLARELNGSYPGWAQGSWLLNRQKDTGNGSRIRVFLRSDPYTYIQFRPFAADRCLMDVVIYDAYLARSVPLPYSLERLLVVPLEEVLSMAGMRFPRRYFDPEPARYRDVRTFVTKVREHLPGLRYRDDGGIDDKGRYVYINSLEGQTGQQGLNCSGFAKWVVDGILRPITGERLRIPPLKQAFGQRGNSFTKPYEDLRDSFFGLDWTRNLASIARTTLLAPGFGKLEEIEVQKWPFSSIIIRNPNGSVIESYPGFLLNAGFGVEGLQPLLYTLAIDEPGNVFLASVNEERGSPPLRTHFHVTVLVPYFNDYGNFQVTVFESASETTFTNFRNRYPGGFVNLVRIPVDGSFSP